MEQILLFMLLNTLGYCFFHFVWTLLPKPKPLDYTTIPGHKLPVRSEEDVPPLSIKPGQPVLKVEGEPAISRGHLDEMDKCGSFGRFLTHSHTLFGDLWSFWWGTRYVIVISGEQFVAELKKYDDAMLALCPIATGSILGGSGHFWTRRLARFFPNPPDRHSCASPKLDRSLQNALLERGPYRTLSDMEVDDTDEGLLSRVVPHLVYDAQMDGLLAALSRPLVVSFNREIEIDAHPIPAFIPIILHASAILSQWSKRGEDEFLHSRREIVRKYTDTFSFLPGMGDVSVLSEIKGGE